MRVEIVEISESKNASLNADNFRVLVIDVILGLAGNEAGLPENLPKLHYTILESEKSMMISWMLLEEADTSWLLGIETAKKEIVSLVDLKEPSQRAAGMVLLEELRNRIRNRMITMKVELPPFWEIRTSGSVMFDTILPE